MKRMLIIGNDYPGITSIPFDDISKENIADYQILLIDLNSFTDLSIPLRTKLKNSIDSLLISGGYPIIIILPRGEIHNVRSDKTALFPFDLHIVPGTGKTIRFDDTNNFMKDFKQYTSIYEIFLTTIPTLPELGGHKVLMRNNINQPCSVVLGDRLFLLHPPDKHLHKKAIEFIIKYYSPDMDEVFEEKAEWLDKYELAGLGLQEIQDIIIDIENKIAELNEKKEKKIAEKITLQSGQTC